MLVEQRENDEEEKRHPFNERWYVIDQFDSCLIYCMCFYSYLAWFIFDSIVHNARVFLDQSQRIVPEQYIDMRYCLVLDSHVLFSVGMSTVNRFVGGI